MCIFSNDPLKLSVIFKKMKPTPDSNIEIASRSQRDRLAEGCATFGLLLICVALAAPFANPSSLSFLAAFKWVYAAGALIYVIARVVGATGVSGSVRLRRLRRMEFWAGVAFMIGAAFWFYSERHLGEYAGVLAVTRTTVMFTLVGAAVQIISSALITSQIKKERGERK